MFGTEALEKIILLILQSAYVTNNEKAVSLLLIAGSGHGKTDSMLNTTDQLIKSGEVFVANNITAGYIQKELLPKIQEGKIKFILIPDMLNALERGKATRELFIAFTRALIEEGLIFQADSYNKFEAKDGKPVKCGMITGMTKLALIENKREWIQNGFLSRFIPFSFTYDDIKLDKIYDIIQYRKKTVSKIKKVRVVPKKIKDNPKLYDELTIISREVSKQYHDTGTRLLKNLMSLCRSNAMLEGRSYVIKKDVDEIIKLCKWINIKCDPL